MSKTQILLSKSKELDYLITKGEIHRRFIRGNARTSLALQLQAIAPSILKLKKLKECTEEALQAGNRNGALSTMLLQKIKSDEYNKNDLDSDFHEFTNKLILEFQSKSEWQGKHYSGFIQDYSWYPFRVVTFTEKVIQYLVDLLKKENVFLSTSMLQALRLLNLQVLRQGHFIMLLFW